MASARSGTTRRGLLGAGAALAAALPAADAPAAGRRAARGRAATWPPPLPGGKRIDTAIATICCDGFGDEDFVPSFETIPKLGIRNVEFNVWYPRNLTPAGLDSIARRCKARGLRPISLQAAGYSPGESNDDQAREVARLHWLIEGCKRLGCRIIKCTGAKRGTRGGLPALVAVLREVLPAAEAAGVAITLENHFDNVLERPEDYDAVFAQLDSPALGICFDMGHFTASGVDLAAFIDRFAPRIYHLDVKDCKAVGTPSFVRYGEGVVPLRETLDHALARGYRGYLVIELSRLDPATMVEDLKVGYALTRPLER